MHINIYIHIQVYNVRDEVSKPKTGTRTAVYSGSYCRTYTQRTSEIRQPGGGGVKLRHIIILYTLHACACVYVCVRVCVYVKYEKLCACVCRVLVKETF